MIANDAVLLPRGRIAHEDLQHKTVDLSFGQWIGPVVLDWVLGGQNHEHRAERMGLASDRDLALLHGLEQRTLDLGGGSVDLVDEQEIGEDWPEVRGEAALASVVDKGADQVSRQQIRSALHAIETSIDRVGERLDRERLRQSGDAFDQEVAAAEQTHEESADEMFLPNDDF